MQFSPLSGIVCFWKSDSKCRPARVSPGEGWAVRAFPVKEATRPHSPLVRGWVTMARAAVAIQIENDMPKKMSQAFTMSAQAADCPRFPTSLCRYWRACGEA